MHWVTHSNSKYWYFTPMFFSKLRKSLVIDDLRLWNVHATQHDFTTACFTDTSTTSVLHSLRGLSAGFFLFTLHFKLWLHLFTGIFFLSREHSTICLLTRKPSSLSSSEVDYMSSLLSKICNFHSTTALNLQNSAGTWEVQIPVAHTYKNPFFNSKVCEYSQISCKFLIPTKKWAVSFPLYLKGSNNWEGLGKECSSACAYLAVLQLVPTWLSLAFPRAS